MDHAQLRSILERLRSRGELARLRDAAIAGAVAFEDRRSLFEHHGDVWLDVCWDVLAVPDGADEMLPRIWRRSGRAVAAERGELRSGCLLIEHEGGELVVVKPAGGLPAVAFRDPGRPESVLVVEATADARMQITHDGAGRPVGLEWQVLERGRWEDGFRRELVWGEDGLPTAMRTTVLDTAGAPPGEPPPQWTTVTWRRQPDLPPLDELERRATGALAEAITEVLSRSGGRPAAGGWLIYDDDQHLMVCADFVPAATVDDLVEQSTGAFGADEPFADDPFYSLRAAWIDPLLPPLLEGGESMLALLEQELQREDLAARVAPLAHTAAAEANRALDARLGDDAPVVLVARDGGPVRLDDLRAVLTERQRERANATGLLARLEPLT